jgi:hypothetical protein
MDKASVVDHYNSAAETYYQQYRRENLSSQREYPANYFRLQILVQRLSALRRIRFMKSASARARRWPR